MCPAQYYGAHLECGSITRVISHLTSSSQPSIVILLSNTDFSRMSVRQPLRHNTYEETPRTSGYCDQEARKSKKNSTIVSYGITAFLFAHL